MKKKILIVCGIIVTCVIGGFGSYKIIQHQKEKNAVELPKNYQNINIETGISIGLEELDDYINQDLSVYRVFQHYDGETVNEHSSVICDVEKYQGEELIDSMASKNYDFEYDDNAAIRNLIVGMKAGEATEGEVIENDESFTYKITVKDVGYSTECNMDNVPDGLIKNVFNLASKDELRNLYQQKYFDEYAESKKSEVIYQSLIANSTVNISENDSKKVIKKVKHQLKRLAKEENLSIGDYCMKNYNQGYDEYMKYIENNAMQWVKENKVLHEVAKRNDITITKDDVTDYIMANGSEQLPQIVNENNMLRANVNDIVTKNAKVSFVVNSVQQ